MAFQAIHMASTRSSDGVRLGVLERTVIFTIGGQVAARMKIEKGTHLQPMWDKGERLLLLTVPNGGHPSARRCAKSGGSLAVRWPHKTGLSFVPALPDEVKSVSLDVVETQLHRLVVKIPERWEV